MDHLSDSGASKTDTNINRSGTNMNYSDHEKNNMMSSGTSNELIDEHRRSRSASATHHRSARPAQNGTSSDNETYTGLHRHTPNYLNGAAPSAQNISEVPLSHLSNSHVSKSWNGLNREPAASNSHDVLSQPTTTKTCLNESVPNQSHTSLCPNGPSPPDPLHEAPVAVVKEREGEEDGSESQRRVQRRLMWSTGVATVCYVTAMLSQMPIMSQYLFRRFALEHFNVTNFTIRKTPCAEGQNNSLQDDLNMIQGKTSQQLLYLDYTQYIPAIFVSLLVGSYADYFGRRFLVLTPMFGSFLKSGMVLLVVYLDLEVDYLYIGFMVEGLLGSFYAMQVGILASIADVTTTARMRVLLMVLLDISLGLAGALSQIGTGFLIDALGFEVPCLIVASLFLLGDVCILFFMPETLRSRPQHLVLNPLVHLRKVFGFYLWDGTLRQRVLFVCGQLILFLVTLVALGRLAVETLYTMNSPFCWGSVRIGFFFGIRFLVQYVGAAVLVKVLSKWVRLELIGMLGLLSGMASFIIQGLAKTDLMMYITVIVGFMIAVVSPIARTLLSRMAPAESQGALFASMSAVETVCHLLAATFYNNVYTATLDVFPGAVFLLTAGILFCDMILLLWFTMAVGKFPHFQEVPVDVKIDVDADADAPSVASSSASCDDETAPLLRNTDSSETRYQNAQRKRPASRRQSKEKRTSEY